MVAHRALFFLIFTVSTAARAQTGGDIASAPKPSAQLIVTELDTRPLDQSRSRPALDALDKTMDKFILDKVPLNQALDAFVAAAHVNASVNWKALQDVGVDRRKVISLQVAQVPAKKILKMILDQAGGTANLYFLVDDNVLNISTEGDLHSAKYQTVVVYDLRPIYADVEIGGQEAANLSQTIVDTLQATVAPDSWRDSGGNVGSARVLNGQLIVNQAIDLQDDVAAYVSQLLRNAHSPTRVYDVRDLVKDDLQTTLAGDWPNRMDALISTIETTCGRDTWRDRGGKTSSVAAFDGKLYVTTNAAVQQQVEQVLAMMRKKD